jgi:hypothetical protein
MTLPQLVLMVEPVWVLAAATFVFLSYLLKMDFYFPWTGLAVAGIPFVLRRAWAGYLSRRTSFDLPIALLLGGALIGLWVSPDFSLSLGAFQSLLAVSLVYYSVVNYPRPALLLKWALPLSALALAVATLLALSAGSVDSMYEEVFDSWPLTLAKELPQPPQLAFQPYFMLKPVHGLAAVLSVAAAISLGIALFSRRLWLRLLTALGCLLFASAMFLLIEESVERLFAWESIKHRIPLWQDTLDMLGERPITGIGLGAWAVIRYGEMLVASKAHPHNSYLELYANAGILGVMALVIFGVIALRLAWGILRAPRKHPWYGFGAGVILAIAITAVVGLIESAPAGIVLTGIDSYYYVISPLPWVLAIFLVLAHRLLTEHI